MSIFKKKEQETPNAELQAIADMATMFTNAGICFNIDFRSKEEYEEYCKLVDPEIEAKRLAMFENAIPLE